VERSVDHYDKACIETIHSVYSKGKYEGHGYDLVHYYSMVEMVSYATDFYL
jgi:hypothetical protein